MVFQSSHLVTNWGKLTSSKFRELRCTGWCRQMIFVLLPRRHRLVRPRSTISKDKRHLGFCICDLSFKRKKVLSSLLKLLLVAVIHSRSSTKISGSLRIPLCSMSWTKSRWDSSHQSRSYSTLIVVQYHPWLTAIIPSFFRLYTECIKEYDRSPYMYTSVNTVYKIRIR